MAQSNNFAADTSNYLQQYQSLAKQANEQQQKFESNQQASHQLQQNLSINENELNVDKDDESKEVKQIEDEINRLRMNNKEKTGIDQNTQGDVTITHNNKQLKSNHYQSENYKDFASMKDILRPELIDGCDHMNYIHPSKIQAEAIPRCLSNNKELQFPNLIGQAHHGSGKTATFALIMLQRIDENLTDLQGLVVVHSRELAIQTYNVCQSLGKFIQNLKIALGLKGEQVPTPWDCQICVGTPGTIIDKYLNAQKRTMNGLKGFLKSFKILIVDEADEFLKSSKQSKKTSSSSSINQLTGRGNRGRGNRGRGRGRGYNNIQNERSSFGSLFDQLKMITTELTSNSPPFQTLLFSATYPTTVKKLALEIAPSPFIIKVAQKQVQLDNIRIYKLVCKDEIDKFNTLLRVISLSNIGQMIIFVNTVSKAKQLIDGLESKDIGISCSALYGRGMDIKLRDETMDQFRKSQTQCLVASNVIARGIDVPAVGLVVNFEIPINQGQSTFNGIQKTGLTFDSETFMHRVGRTGRFGAKGVCINLVAQNDKISNDRLDAIQKEYSLNISPLTNTSNDIKHSISQWLNDDDVD